MESSKYKECFAILKHFLYPLGWYGNWCL